MRHPVTSRPSRPPSRRRNKTLAKWWGVLSILPLPDEIEWPRTGTSFAALVLDCDTRRSIELAHACAMNAQPLPTPTLTLVRKGRGTLHASWFLARP